MKAFFVLDSTRDIDLEMSGFCLRAALLSCVDVFECCVGFRGIYRIRV